MASDPVVAALDKLAAYFGGLTGIGLGRRGWPENAGTLTLSPDPMITVTFVSSDRYHCPPTLLNTASPFLWKVGGLDIVAQLDLWAAFRIRREEAARVLEIGFHNDMPFRSGLFLDSTDYHGRPLSIIAGGRQTVDSDKGAIEGLWRAMWTLEIQTDLVLETDADAVPTQETITLVVTANDTEEPELDITA